MPVAPCAHDCIALRCVALQDHPEADCCKHYEWVADEYGSTRSKVYFFADLTVRADIYLDSDYVSDPRASAEGNTSIDLNFAYGDSKDSSSFFDELDVVFKGNGSYVHSEEGSSNTSGALTHYDPEGYHFMVELDLNALGKIACAPSYAKYLFLRKIYCTSPEFYILAKLFTIDLCNVCPPQEVRHNS